MKNRNKPFPNYSVEIAEMSREEVEDMRIRLPLVVNDLCAEVMYDTGATHSHCDDCSYPEWAGSVGEGRAWVKFKYGQLIQGSREFAAINERDGVKLGIYVTGIAPVHAGANR